MDRIGVIGLGRMGSAIAAGMQDEGRAVLGWTRSGRTVEGVESAPDLATLVDGSDVLVLSLFDREPYFGHFRVGVGDARDSAVVDRLGVASGDVGDCGNAFGEANMCELWGSRDNVPDCIQTGLSCLHRRRG